MQQFRIITGRYWIVYGIFEGPRHRRYLDAALKEIGLTPARSLEEADLILAHSGGCFSLPGGLHDKTVFLCQPACGWKGKRVPIGLMINKTVLDLKAHLQRRQMLRWTWRSSLNIFYALARPAYNGRIIRDATLWRFRLAPVDAEKVTVIISRLDPWSHKLPLTEVDRYPKRRFVTLPGAHDDLWTDPEQLVGVLRSVYEA